MNRLEELLFSTLIISILIVINIGFAFTSVKQIEEEKSPLAIYLEVQDAFLNGRRPEPDSGDVYLVVVLNGTVIYEYGVPAPGTEPYLARYPIMVNGSIGELYCWIIEGG